jgi:hypothetical protein
VDLYFANTALYLPYIVYVVSPWLGLLFIAPVTSYRHERSLTFVQLSPCRGLQQAVLNSATSVIDLGIVCFSQGYNQWTAVTSTLQAPQVIYGIPDYQDRTVCAGMWGRPVNEPPFYAVVRQHGFVFWGADEAGWRACVCRLS